MVMNGARKEYQHFSVRLRGGEAVTTLWKEPRKLMEAQAHFLIEKHAEFLSCAYHGTTLTIALTNLTWVAWWVAGVSDLTMGDWIARLRLTAAYPCWTPPALSYMGSDGNWSGERLLDLHTLTMPSEYFRVSMSYPTAEQDIFLGDQLLSTLSMTWGMCTFGGKKQINVTESMWLPCSHQ